MIPVSTTSADRIVYAEEQETKDGMAFKQREAQVSRQTFDVTDPEAREKAAQEMGLTGDHYEQHAMWFIRPADNAAALVVYRPKQ